MKIFILAEGVKIEYFFLTLSGKESSLVHTFVNLLHTLVLLIRLMIQGCPAKG